MKDAGLNVEETRLGGRTKEFAPRSAEVRGFMGVDRRDEGETMYPMVTRWGAAMREDVLCGDSERSGWNGRWWQGGVWKRVA
jgi:hypothetical protein